MRNVGIILRRELASYFATPLAYIFILIFLVLANAFTFYLGGFYERGQADLDAVLHLPSLAVPVPDPGDLHEAVGRGAQVRQHRAADDPAGDAAGRRCSASSWRRGSSPRSRWRSPSRCGSRSTTSASPTTARSSPPTWAACCSPAASSPSARACRRSPATRWWPSSSGVVACFVFLLAGFPLVLDCVPRLGAAGARRCDRLAVAS